jgi:protein giant
MKNSFEYSFHQHHPQLHHLARPQQVDQVLDLSAKRRDSTETRKTTSPSSFEEGSPDTRHSPINTASQLLLHPHISLPKAQFTPEHAVQYRYNYDHTSPTSSSSMKPTAIFERFESSARMGKQENISPPPQPKSVSPQHFHIRPIISESHHEDSNDLPAINSNISSSSSTASSQKSPSSSVNSQGMMVVGRDGKLSRPFKAYPRDPLSLAAAGSILDSSSAEKYSVFRKRMLEQIHAANGGNPVINNPKMRRITSKGSNHETNNNEIAYDSGSEKRQIQSSPSSGNDKDEAYFERRRKNNAAAKKSRDRRRIKEDEIAIRAAFLERENIELKFELAAARKQLTLYTSGLTASLSDR